MPNIQVVLPFFLKIRSYVSVFDTSLGRLLGLSLARYHDFSFLQRLVVTTLFRARNSDIPSGGKHGMRFTRNGKPDDGQRSARLPIFQTRAREEYYEVKNNVASNLISKRETIQQKLLWGKVI